MTAYASADYTEADISVSAEIRSYNHRFLDLVLRAPHGYQAIEDRIKAIVAGKVARGRLEIKLQIKDNSPEAAAFEIDPVRALAYRNALEQLKELINGDMAIPLEWIARADGVIKAKEVVADIESRWIPISTCVTRALNALVDMRKKEGDFIARDFSKRLAFIEDAVGNIEKDSEGLLAIYQDRLRDRIAALTKDTVEIDPVRLAQEAALLADRSDISEEIIRAYSHIQQFRDAMESDEPAGRKLNFLLQELNREVNTMGAKTGNARVSQWTVEIKTELEKLREQVQNVE